MRESVEAKRTQLVKERAEYAQAIAMIEQTLAQHRIGLERIDGALVVVESLLAGPGCSMADAQPDVTLSLAEDAA